MAFMDTSAPDEDLVREDEELNLFDSIPEVDDEPASLSFSDEPDMMDDGVLTRQSQLFDAVPSIDMPPSLRPDDPQSRNVVQDIGAAALGGAYDTIRGGFVAPVVAGLDFVGAIDGEKVTDFIQQVEGFAPTLRPSKEAEDSYLRRSIYGGVRSASRNIGTIYTGARLGKLAGLKNPMNTAAPGLTYVSYGADAYNDFVHQAMEEDVDPAKAKALAVAAGTLEGGVEAASTWIETALAGLTGRAGQPIKAAAKKTLREKLMSLVKGYGKTYLVEQIEETIQGEGGEGLKALGGMEHEDFGKATIEGAGATAIASATLFGAGRYARYRQDGTARKKLKEVGTPDAVIEDILAQEDPKQAQQKFDDWQAGVRAEVAKAGETFDQDKQAIVTRLKEIGADPNDLEHIGAAANPLELANRLNGWQVTSLMEQGVPRDLAEQITEAEATGDTEKADALLAKYEKDQAKGNRRRDIKKRMEDNAALRGLSIEPATGTENVDAYADAPGLSFESVEAASRIPPGLVPVADAETVNAAAAEAHAREIYNRNYQKGWKGLGSITAMTPEQFKAWAESDGPSAGPVAAQSKVRDDEDQADETAAKPQPIQTAVTKPQKMALRLEGVKEVIPAASMEDAARKWDAFRDKSGGGASELPRAFIVDIDTGEDVARISYNGRIWPVEGWKPGAKELVERDDGRGYGKKPAIDVADNSEVADPALSQGAAGTMQPVSDYAAKHVFNKPRGERVPDAVFDIARVHEKAADSISSQLPEAVNVKSGAQISMSGRALKHADEGHHDDIARILPELSDILSGPDLEVLRNPKRDNSVLVVREGKQHNDIIVLETTAAGNLEVVNVFHKRAKDLRSLRRKAKALSEGRQLPHRHAPEGAAPVGVSSARQSNTIDTPNKADRQPKNIGPKAQAIKDRVKKKREAAAQETESTASAATDTEQAAQIIADRVNRKRSPENKDPASAFMASARQIKRAVADKNADALIGDIARVPGENEGFKAAFEFFAGVKLPKGKKRIAAFLDEWAGVTPEERAERDEKPKGMKSRPRRGNKPQVSIRQFRDKIMAALAAKDYTGLAADELQSGIEADVAGAVNDVFTADQEHTAEAYGWATSGGGIAQIARDLASPVMRTRLEQQFPEGTVVEYTNLDGKQVQNKILYEDGYVRLGADTHPYMFADELKITRPKSTTDVEASAPPPETADDGKIRDFGEKIGGARKDTAQRGNQQTAPKAGKADKRPPWQQRYQVEENPVRPGMWRIRDTKSRSRSIPRQDFNTKAEAEAAIPLIAVAEKHRVYTDDDGKYAIYRRISDRKRIRVVKDGFDSREEAMKHMATHAEELLSLKTTFGEEILPTPDIARRVGKPHRDGDVTPTMFMDTFAPRGIEFGNWNNQEERQMVMNHAYDGLLDLAEVMNVPPKALTLNGELAIAFGSRGQGLSGAKAHYERDHAVINLTKMSGAGHLAHEWMHAFDHYLGRLDGKASSEKVDNPGGGRVYKAKTRTTDYQSHGPSLKSGMRERLREKYRELVTSLYTKAEQYVEDTERAERFLGAARDNLAAAIQSARNDLTRDDTKYRKHKFAAPAPEEIVAEFDRTSATLLEGGDLSLEWTRDEESKSKYGNYRWTSPTLEKLSKLMKAGKNRSGFTKEQSGPLNRVASAIKTYADRLNMFEDAKSETTKTKKVPTDFAVEAKKMDQARTSDYWTEPHEMIARAFAAFVEDEIAEAGGASEFLVYKANGGVILPMLDGFIARPYPEGAERIAINAAFRKFISEIRVEDSERGAIMYSVTDDLPLDDSPPNMENENDEATQAQTPAQRAGQTDRGERAGSVPEDGIGWQRRLEDGRSRLRGQGPRNTETALDAVEVDPDLGQTPEFRAAADRLAGIGLNLVPVTRSSYIDGARLGDTVYIAASGSFTIDQISRHEEFHARAGEAAAQELIDEIDRSSNAFNQYKRRLVQLHINRYLAAGYTVAQANKAARAYVTNDLVAEEIAADVFGGVQRKFGVRVGSAVRDRSRANERVEQMNQRHRGQMTGTEAVTPAQDRAYLDAVERGDTETAMTMVDAAAKAAGYTIRAYHGTDQRRFNRFATGDQTHTGFAHFSDNRDIAERFANGWAEASGTGQPMVYDVFLKAGTPSTQGIDYGGGYTEYLVDDPTNIKSADPVTYDPEGNVIPLSQRFNDESDDIRFSMFSDDPNHWSNRPLGSPITEDDVRTYRAEQADMRQSLNEAAFDIIDRRGMDYARDFITEESGPERWQEIREAYIERKMNEADIESGRAQFSLRDPVPTYYSALLRTVETAKQPRAPAAQWLSWLKKQPGVKQEELDWTGVGPWMQEQKRPITREELADFIKANQIEVRESIKVSEPSEMEDSNLLLRLRSRGYDVASDYGETAYLATMNGEYVDDADPDLPDDVRQLWERIQLENAHVGRARYDQYTVPGGRKYKELLLLLPHNVLDDPLAADQRAIKGTYLTSHFDEPNIVAHVRFAEHLVPRFSNSQMADIERRIVEAVRRGPDDNLKASSLGSGAPEMAVRKGLVTQEEADAYGASRGFTNAPENADKTRVLLVEEVQSDWHQRGREGGYDNPAMRKRIADKLAGEEQLTEEEEAERKRLMERPVPDAPFKTTWPMLAMKRVIRWAAENGYDRVAMTPGDVQVDRYSLDHEVDMITARNRVKGEGRNVLIHLKHRGYPMEFDIDGDGIIREVKTVPETMASPAGKPLSDLIGKDLAGRILNDPITGKDTDPPNPYGPPQNIYEGNDLKMGGEGMRTFYDKMLPAAINKYVKRWGAKLAPLPMDIGQELGSDIAEDVDAANKFGVYDDNEVLLADYATEAEAEAYIEQQQITQNLPASAFYIKPINTVASVPSFEITPEMKAAALAGQPLFSRSTGTGMTAAAANKAVAPIIARLNRPEDVAVVDTPADIEDLYDAAIIRRAIGDYSASLPTPLGGRIKTASVSGVRLMNGHIYLFANELADADEAVEVLLEEIAHNGFENIPFEEIETVMDEAFAGNTFMRNTIYRAATREVERNYPGLNRNTTKNKRKFYNEVLAHIAAKRDSHPGIWRRFVDAMRRMFARLTQGTRWEPVFSEQGTMPAVETIVDRMIASQTRGGKQLRPQDAGEVMLHAKPRENLIKQMAIYNGKGPYPYYGYLVGSDAEVSFLNTDTGKVEVVPAGDVQLVDTKAVESTIQPPPTKGKKPSPRPKGTRKPPTKAEISQALADLREAVPHMMALSAAVTSQSIQKRKDRREAELKKQRDKAKAKLPASTAKAAVQMGYERRLMRMKNTSQRATKNMMESDVAIIRAMRAEIEKDPNNAVKYLNRALKALFLEEDYEQIRGLFEREAEKRGDMRPTRRSETVLGEIESYFGRKLSSYYSTKLVYDLARTDFTEPKLHPDVRADFIALIDDVPYSYILDLKEKRAKLKFAKSKKSGKGPDAVNRMQDAYDNAIQRVAATFRGAEGWETLKDWHDRASEIWATSQRLQYMIRSGRKVERAETAKNIAAEIVATSKPLRGVMDRRGRRSRGITEGKLIDIKLNQMTRALQLGGGDEASASFDVFGQKIEQAETKMLDLQRQILGEDGLKGREAELGIREKDWIEWSTDVRKVTLNGQHISLTSAEIMDLMATIQDPENLAELAYAPLKLRRLNGLPVSVSFETAAEAEDAILELIDAELSQKQKDIVLWMVETLTDMGEAGNKVTRHLYGQDLFTNPRYWPREREILKKQNGEIVTDVNQLVTRKDKFLEHMGLSKERVANKRGLMLSNVIMKFKQHVEKMSAYTHMTVAVADALSMLHDATNQPDAPGVSEAIRQRYGSDYLERMSEIYQRTAGLSKYSDDWTGIEKALAWVERHASVSILWGRISTILFNRIGGSILTVSELENRHRGKGLAYLKYLGLPSKAFWLSKANREAREAILKNGYFWRRWSHDFVHVQANLPIDEAEAQLSKTRNAMRKLQEFGMRPMAEAEMKNTVAAYRVLRDAGMSEATAIREIEQITRASQNPSSPLQESVMYENIKRSGLGVVLPFMGQPTVAAAMLERDVIKLKGAVRKRNGKAAARAARAVGLTGTALVGNVVMTAIVRALLRGAADGEWPWEDERNMYYTGMNLITEGIDILLPGGGKLVDSIIGLWKYGAARDTSLIGRISESLSGGIKQIAKLRDDDPDNDNMLRAADLIMQGVSMLFGLPYSGPGATAKAAYGMATANVPMPRGDLIKKASNAIYTTSGTRDDGTTWNIGDPRPGKEEDASDLMQEWMREYGSLDQLIDSIREYRKKQR